MLFTLFYFSTKFRKTISLIPVRNNILSNIATGQFLTPVSHKWTTIIPSIYPKYYIRNWIYIYPCRNIPFIAPVSHKWITIIPSIYPNYYIRNWIYIYPCRNILFVKLHYLRVQVDFQSTIHFKNIGALVPINDLYLKCIVTFML